MNTNDLVYKIAERVKDLQDNHTLFGLRSMVASENATTPHAVAGETRGKSREELIEEIITEEFCEEFPQEIGDSETVRSPGPVSTSGQQSK